MHDIAARLQRLEEAVFGKGEEAAPRSATPSVDDHELLTGVFQHLLPRSQKLAEGDRLVVQFVVSGQPEPRVTGHASSLAVLRDEEADEGVARLCSVLGSKQRISILKHLSLIDMSNGELAEATGMAGGHLHHHLRDLLSLALVEKRDDGHYFATEAGINTYLTVAGLHRRLAYDDRTSFQMNLPRMEGD